LISARKARSIPSLTPTVINTSSSGQYTSP